MKSKKSYAFIEVIGILFLAVFFVFVISNISTRLLGKGSAEASELLSSSRDYDGDGISDFNDKCDCLFGEERNEGCPTNEPTAGDKAIKREEECKKKIKSAYK